MTVPAGVSLTDEHQAVVGSGTDTNGIADAVLVKRGAAAKRTELISDIPLEPGDRLSSFLQIGESVYLCWLEY